MEAVVLSHNIHAKLIDANGRCFVMATVEAKMERADDPADCAAFQRLFRQIDELYSGRRWKTVVCERQNAKGEYELDATVTAWFANMLEIQPPE